MGFIDNKQVIFNWAKHKWKFSIEDTKTLIKQLHNGFKMQKNQRYFLPHIKIQILFSLAKLKFLINDQFQIKDPEIIREIKYFMIGTTHSVKKI